MQPPTQQQQQTTLVRTWYTVPTEIPTPVVCGCLTLIAAGAMVVSVLVFVRNHLE